jgi:hypothetical protein
MHLTWEAVDGAVVALLWPLVIWIVLSGVDDLLVDVVASSFPSAAAYEENAHLDATFWLPRKSRSPSWCLSGRRRP